MRGNIIIIIFLASLILNFSDVRSQENIQEFTIETIIADDGKLLDRVTINSPPEPPAGIPLSVAKYPLINTRGSLILACVPAFNWCFGSAPTSAAMMAGYYDIIGHTNMYAGPENGSVMPLDNSTWPDVLLDEWRHSCPLSASMEGLDGRLTKGHVDDYWIAYGSPGPDPWVGNWLKHTDEDCTGDYMFTSQWDIADTINRDGSTIFYFFNDSTATHWYDLSGYHDGGKGLRDFMISRGYTVTDEYNQYITNDESSNGFSFSDYKNQIDYGQPVIIHTSCIDGNHSMLGYGYDDSDSSIYINDTWDYLGYTMKWGDYYAGIYHHYGVTVLELADITYTDLTIKNSEVRTGKTINFEATGSITGSGLAGLEYLTIQGTGSNGGCATMTAPIIYLKNGFHAQEGCEFIAHAGAPPPQPALRGGPITKEDQDWSINEESSKDEVERMSFIKFYPNPCHGNFMILLTQEPKELLSLEVFDLMGIVVYRKENISSKLLLVDITSQPKGIYIVRIIFDGEMFQEKVIYN